MSLKNFFQNPVGSCFSYVTVKSIMEVSVPWKFYLTVVKKEKINWTHVYDCYCLDNKVFIFDFDLECLNFVLFLYPVSTHIYIKLFCSFMHVVRFGEVLFCIMI